MGPFGDIAFISDSTGFVAGDGGVIVRTDDRGDNWTNVDNKIATFSILYAVRTFWHFYLEFKFLHQCLQVIRLLADAKIIVQ